MRVWIFQTGEPLHIDGDNYRPMRAMNLANILIKRGHYVTIWSSAFYHQEKKHRALKYTKVRYNDFLEIRLIPSTGYIKNISFKRLYDHFSLAYNLKNILKKEVLLPDVAFIGYPPIEFAYIAQKWLTNKKVKTILDVKDLWPEIFILSLPKSIKKISKILLFPYFYIAKQTIKNATAISSMTDSFLNYMVSSFGRKRSKIDLAIPFSSPKIELTNQELEISNKWWNEFGLNKKTIFRVCYIGNISPNVDLDPIEQAATYFKKKSIEVEFVICGSGISFEEYKKKFSEIDNIKFAGKISHSQAVSLSKISNASLIPYKNSIDFQLSLPNKFIDSLSYGLPVFSSLSGEVANMIEKYNIGFSYGKSFDNSLIDGINLLLNNNNLSNKMITNCKNLYQKDFTYEKVYEKLASHLVNIS